MRSLRAFTLLDVDAALADRAIPGRQYTASFRSSGPATGSEHLRRIR